MGFNSFKKIGIITIIIIGVLIGGRGAIIN